MTTETRPMWVRLLAARIEAERPAVLASQLTAQRRELCARPSCPRPPAPYSCWCRIDVARLVGSSFGHVA